LAFSGIHVISPRMLPMMTAEGAFSIIPTYLDLSARGEDILAFCADEYYWLDLGKPENIRQATEDASQSPGLIRPQPERPMGDAFTASRIHGAVRHTPQDTADPFLENATRRIIV
jgi:NDP-sugar pyrophosphorylase family protein